VCTRYGSAPQIVACSATIANPGDHLRRLAGVEAVVVSGEADGAPHGAKDFVLWNPPFIDPHPDSPAQRQYRGGAAVAHLVQAGIRTIAFTRARRVAELILLYARRILEDESPALADGAGLPRRLPR